MDRAERAMSLVVLSPESAAAAVPWSLAPPTASAAAASAAPAANDATPIRARVAEGAAGRLSFDATLDLRHAGPRRLRLACEWQGAAERPVVVVAGGISAHRHLAASAAYSEPGWWQAQVGAGRALDPARVRLLSLDWIGSDGTLDAPIDSADQADAIAAVLDRLGIAGVAAFVGASYGAMVGLQFAARHGARLGALVAISGGDRAHPYAQAWRALQRRILALGASEGGRREALSLARQLAMLSYRTPEEFALRFDAAPAFDAGRARFPAEDYLRHCGERYVARTPAVAFERLSESIDLHEVEAASVRVPTILVAVREDRLLPCESLIDLAGRLPALRRLHVLRSLFGHDAFLKEEAAIDRVLREALAEVAA
jgi:homoserine O-acetyltransferase